MPPRVNHDGGQDDKSMEFSPEERMFTSPATSTTLLVDCVPRFMPVAIKWLIKQSCDKSHTQILQNQICKYSVTPFYGTNTFTAAR